MLVKPARKVLRFTLRYLCWHVTARTGDKNNSTQERLADGAYSDEAEKVSAELKDTTVNAFGQHCLIYVVHLNVLLSQ